MAVLEDIRRKFDEFSGRLITPFAVNAVNNVDMSPLQALRFMGSGECDTISSKVDVGW